MLHLLMHLHGNSSWCNLAFISSRSPFQSQRYIWLLSRTKDNTETQNPYKGKYQFQQAMSEPSNTQNNIFWWFFFCIINSVKSEPIRNLFTSLRRLFFPNNLSANTSKIDFPTRIYHPSPLEYIFLIQGTPIQSSLTLNKQHLPRPTIEKVEKWGLFMRSEVVFNLCFDVFDKSVMIHKVMKYLDKKVVIGNLPNFLSNTYWKRSWATIFIRESRIASI